MIPCRSADRNNRSYAEFMNDPWHSGENVRLMKSTYELRLQIIYCSAEICKFSYRNICKTMKQLDVTT